MTDEFNFTSEYPDNRDLRDPEAVGWEYLYGKVMARAESTKDGTESRENQTESILGS